MNNRPNPKLIGAFVLGGVTLAAIAVGVLGSGKLFRHAIPFVLYFPTSVEGLNVGAPVKFKGVEVGAVSRILLNLDRPEMSEANIPVFVDVDMDKVMRKGGPLDLEDPVVFHNFVERGLRAELESQSLLTGQLFVELDFHPEIPARFVQPADYRYREIPTIPNTLERAGLTVEELLNQLKRANLPALVRSATVALDGVRNLVESPEIRRDLVAVGTTLRNADRAMAGLDQTASRLEQRVGPLATSLVSTSEQTRQTVVRAEAAIARADAAIEDVQTTLAAVRVQIEPGSPISHELLRTLGETAAAARSVRELAEYLQRNPSSLVLGRPASAEPQ
ncbi:MAG TPA: MlaD family protein [Thermoanaerobaculia bacterium]|nr:MlaD family protein [Thermoanaerobaculia bacterium]